MTYNGHSILENVLYIINAERAEDVPLIRFKHPKELEDILDLDVTTAVNDDKLEKCVKQILKYSVKTNKPTFKNQLYGGTDPYGLAGAWIAEAFNTSQYTFEVAPAFTLIEIKILKHVLSLFGIPNGDGIFSPGGSISMLYALVSARYKAFPEVKTTGMRNLPEMVIFTSDDSHYSIKKAAHWLGFGTDNVIRIKTNEYGQVIVNELEAAIKEEKSKGKYPILVNATAGTTVLGAIDDLERVSEVCQKFKIWLHVDACWGGSLILSSTHRKKLSGIEKADSISWNPHKMAGAPLQCSMYLVRKKNLLHEANSASAEYLFHQDKFYDVNYDTGDKSVQCGRKIDAFKLWLMWKARGDAGLNHLADQTISIAELCLKIIKNREGFKLVTDRIQSPNVCFWYIPRFMRAMDMDGKWWDMIHKVTPKIKELLTLSSRLMIAYSPLRHHKNFFRLAFTFYPKVEEKDLLEMLIAIEECGEMVTPSMLR